ncbi:hypothetical protein [Roseiterribacter gracilis]|uniref:Uncharacterized protein n=1 Tax=Roseiterribacter gracilis TaxID=2812848 RepID=A0A8S8XB45_9PROT|nr:hypothetical protein TMPK1_29300 [Rhodospirillales bacterium TMPK1]
MRKSDFTGTLRGELVEHGTYDQVGRGSLFNSLSWSDPDGDDRQAGILAGPQVADEVRKGGPGLWYIQRGILFAVRRPDGIVIDDVGELTGWREITVYMLWAIPFVIVALAIAIPALAFVAAFFAVGVVLLWLGMRGVPRAYQLRKQLDAHVGPIVGEPASNAA